MEFDDCPMCPECSLEASDASPTFSCAFCRKEVHYVCAGFSDDLDFSPNLLEILAASPVLLRCPQCQKKPVSALQESPDSSPNAKRPADVSTAILNKLESMDKRMNSFADEAKEIQAKLASVSEFLAPAKAPRTFASVAKSSSSGASSFKPKTIADTVSQALARQSEDALNKRCVIIAGLKTDDGDDLVAKVGEIWTELGISDAVRTVSVSRLPRARNADPSSPALLRATLLEEGMASLACSLGKSLCGSASFSRVYLRPARSAEERSILRLRQQRLVQLKAANEDDSVRYAINYRRDGYPIIRIVAGSVESWTDPGPQAPSASSSGPGQDFRPQ